jgi:hypothetical protein
MDNNKGERNRKTKVVFKRRLRRRGILDKSGLPKDHQYDLKSQGKPCSCFMCSPYKYKRKIKHKENYEEEREENT